MTELIRQIAAFNENLAARLPTESLQAFETSIKDLSAMDMETGVIGIGDRFPDFTLPDTEGEMISLKALLKKGRLIIVFFRGSWCPYCNLQLIALQKEIKLLEDRQVTLIAISPQLPKYSADMKESRQLAFGLLADQDNVLATRIGLAFKVQDYVIGHYESLNIDLTTNNGNDSYMLPITAIFVLGTDGVIRYRFADPNYMNRLSISELIQHL